MSLPRALLFFGFLLGTIGCDQGTKRLAEATLKGTEPMAMLHGTVRLLYAENPGAWGSLGATWPEGIKTVFLVAFPLLVLLAMLVFVLRSKELGGWQQLGMALLIGGGLGNLIDRIVDGHVIDFLYLGVGGVGTNIFNVADVALLAGIALTLLRRRARPSEPGPA